MVELVLFAVHVPHHFDPLIIRSPRAKYISCSNVCSFLCTLGEDGPAVGLKRVCMDQACTPYATFGTALTV
jgi:hypothetical protein